MFKAGRKVSVAVPFSEGGNLTEPYIKSTDEYVRETDVTYIVQSDNIRVEGHPFKSISSGATKTPFVNPSRFTVAEMELPDMNKLYLPPYQGEIGLDTEVSVWKLLGLRVDVQGPISPAVTGQRFSGAKSTDSGFTNTINADDGNITQDFTWGMEHKQVQMLAVGCEPLKGVYEGVSKQKGDTNRNVQDIEDGDMHDFGYGNVDYINLMQDQTLLPVEMCFNNGPTMIPDRLGMDTDKKGNCCFFMWERSAGGIRHTRHTEGIAFPDDTVVGDATPIKDVKYFPQVQNTMTAGMVSSNGDIFNRNYWLNKAKGPNNCVLWGNKMIVTFVDNTRGFIMMLTTVTAGDDEDDIEAITPYDPSKTNAYLRHLKEFRITTLVRLCKVKLEAKLITWLLQNNSDWLKNLGFNFRLGPQSLGVNGFHNVYQEEEVKVDEPVNKVSRRIHIDCSGHVSLTASNASLHPLAVAFHEAVGQATPKPKVGAKRTIKARKLS